MAGEGAHRTAPGLGSQAMSTGSYYKIVGLIKDGDQLTITTDSRARARHYAAQMLASKAYEQVQVEQGTQVYVGEAIGRMP